MELSSEERKAIASTIIQQLGGRGGLAFMIGADRFTYDKDGSLRFHFKGCQKANVVKITLNSLDLYDITFYKYKPAKLEVKVVEELENVYDDNLKLCFESFTGLYLSLF